MKKIKSKVLSKSEVRRLKVMREGASKMTPAQVKEAQVLVGEIGAGKKEGFIMVCGMAPTIKGQLVKGVSYIHDVSPKDVASVLVNNSGFPAAAFLEALKDSMLGRLKGVSGRMVGHDHDEDGNCIK